MGNILVTEGAGFIGSQLVESLVEIAKFITCALRGEPYPVSGDGE